MKAKKLKIIGIAVMTVVIVCLIAGFIYFDKHYAVINKKIYRNDIKTIRGTNLRACSVSFKNNTNKS